MKEGMAEKQPCWIYLDGVFDLCHSGHFNAMRQAKLLGTHICVGINSDLEVLAAKGARPILDVRERASIMGACRWVDRVILDAPYETSLSQLKLVAQCDYAAHGDDFVIGASGRDCYAEPRSAGLMKVFRRTNGISTTSIVCRVLLAARALGIAKSKTFPKLRESLYRKPVCSPVDLRRLTEFVGSARLDRMRQRAVAIQRGEQRNALYIQGGFDGLRDAHIQVLRHCRSLSDYLIIGLLDDEALGQEGGSSYLPILAQTERMLSLYALSDVDDVIMNPPQKLDESFFSRYSISLALTRREDKQWQFTFVNESGGLSSRECDFRIPSGFDDIRGVLQRAVASLENGSLSNLQDRQSAMEEYNQAGCGALSSILVEL